MRRNPVSQVLQMDGLVPAEMADDLRGCAGSAGAEAEKGRTKGILENVISRRYRRMGMNLEVKKYGTFGSEE